MTSYMTQEELDELNQSSLSREAPFLIQFVKSTQFSVARHYGAATYNGWAYTYFPATDELIRKDVVKWLARHRKFKAQMQKAESVQDSIDMFGGE